MRGSGTAHYGSLLFYEISGKEFRQYSLPSLPDTLAEHYGGQDIFTHPDNAILRRFPLYQIGDLVCCPSGGIAQLYYQFHDEQLTLNSYEVKPEQELTNTTQF